MFFVERQHKELNFLGSTCVKCVLHWDGGETFHFESESKPNPTVEMFLFIVMYAGIHES